VLYYMAIMIIVVAHIKRIVQKLFYCKK